jgi:hypothetical protein
MLAVLGECIGYFPFESTDAACSSNNSFVGSAEFGYFH